MGALHNHFYRTIAKVTKQRSIKEQPTTELAIEITRIFEQLNDHKGPEGTA
jgi:hypothetical protein